MNYNNRNGGSGGIGGLKDDKNASYPKLIDEVNNYWQENIKTTEKIKGDIKTLERMFNEYGSNPIFIQAKTILLQAQEHQTKILNNLEEQFYILKRNFNIN